MHNGTENTALIADLAQYFPARTETEPGYLITKAEVSDEIKGVLSDKHWKVVDLAEEGVEVARYKYDKSNKIKAYNLQEHGQDTVDANISLGFAPDMRDYGVGAQILLDLGYEKFNLITNNPKKMIALSGYGLEIVDRVAVEPYITEFNEKYMECKKERMEHMY